MDQTRRRQGEGSAPREKLELARRLRLLKYKGIDVAAGTPVGRGDEGLDVARRAGQPIEIDEPDRRMAPRRDDAIDCACAKARDALEHVARRPVDVEREAFGMRERPCELRID